jgi:coproporphyrinogen III oxidase-like Fe-S oxidoreductase
MTAFGIDIHWPYCAAKHPYCDFNSRRIAAGSASKLPRRQRFAKAKKNVLQLDDARC